VANAPIDNPADAPMDARIGTDGPLLRPQAGCLLSLRLRASDAAALELLAPGLSQLAHLDIGRQMAVIWSGEPLLWLRLGPDEWWCWCAQGHQAQVLMRSVAQALQGVFHACVDLSDGQQCLLLAAPVRSLLSLGCDLDFERLPRELATRTRLASFPVVLAVTADQGMLLWVEASLSLSLQQWLTRAAVAVGD
jgi:heterotetrameric sarcosine oxidase gamma subunit